MAQPKLRDYVGGRDGLGALPVYRVYTEESGEIMTILPPNEAMGESLVSSYTLRDYLYYIHAHPKTKEAENAPEILEEMVNCID